MGLLEKLESEGFECDGGSLTGFVVWQELKRRVVGYRKQAQGDDNVEALASAHEEIERLRACEPVPNMLDMVERFNREIIGLQIPDKPTMLERHRSDFRRGHLLEELSEIAHGADHEDMSELVDGLLDLIYVAMGWLVEMGVTVGASFEEVHAANMAKERGELARRPGSKGYDAVKPEGWTPPDLAPYLSLTRGEVAWMMDQREIADTWVPGEDDNGEEEEETSKTYEILPRRRPRILVIGHARHGKDTVCGMLRDMYSLKFTSSSRFCAEHVVMSYMDKLFKDGGHDVRVYETADECFEDRAKYRRIWYDAIRAYNQPDPTALARAILEENDVYCGMRASAELHACRNAGVFDHVIWVDASLRCKPEGKDSCTVEPWMADHVVDANGTIEDTMFNLKQLMDRILI